MSFSSSEIRELLCPKPYICGPQSANVPPELVETSGADYLQIMQEYQQGTAIVSRCSGCNKLAVRRLNIVHPNCKIILDVKGMTEVPGGGMIEGENRRRNLFADSFLYASEFLGVGSLKDIMILGSIPDDANRSFPMDDGEETKAEGAQEDPNSETSADQCAQCGKNEGDLSKCKGACGGAVAYCNKECQVKHWKQGHKHVCWKVAASNAFSFKNEADVVVPLRVLHSVDGFGKSACCLYYSNHMGEAVSAPIADQILGDWDPEDFEETIHCLPTSPIYDEVERASLKPGEACFNVSKYPMECHELAKHGIITQTDKTLQIGYYPTRHPVCRINLPLYEPEESE